MRKILVTGGAGNVAGSLVKRLVQNPNNFVVVVDNLLTGSKTKLPSADYTNWRFIKANVNDYNDIVPIFSKHSFEYVFHYAAVVGVNRTLDNPMWVFDDIKGFENVFGLSKNTGVKRVFYSSSSEVYGEPVEFPQHEVTTPLNARLPYSIVKNLGESMLKAYQKDYGLDYTIFRFFNTYGPMQSEDFVLPRFIDSALKNKPITVYGKGDQTRTFCYIDDNIDTTLAILENDLMINDVLNIGHDKEMTILSLAKTVIDITNSQSEIIFLPPLKEGDMSRRCPDNQQMRSILKRELTPLEKGIKNLMSHKTNLVVA
jgi:UDP-glucuronate decarboxylase